MEELVDLIASEASPSDVSDRIKDVLYAKASERIDGIRATVGSSMFDDSNLDTEEEQDG